MQIKSSFLYSFVEILPIISSIIIGDRPTWSLKSDIPIVKCFASLIFEAIIDFLINTLFLISLGLGIFKDSNFFQHFCNLTILINSFGSMLDL